MRRLLTIALCALCACIALGRDYIALDATQPSRLVYVNTVGGQANYYLENFSGATPTPAATINYQFMEHANYIEDESPEDNDGGIMGNVVYDASNNGFWVDGTNGHVRSRNNYATSGTNQRTILTRIRATTIALAVNFGGIQYYGTLANGAEWMVYQRGISTPDLFYMFDGGGPEISSGVAATTNTVDIVCMYTGAKAWQMYIDGILKIDSTIADFNTTASQIDFGEIRDSPEFFQGYFEEVRAYPTDLTSNQIFAITDSQTYPTNAMNLHYPMTNDVVREVQDSSGNGITADADWFTSTEPLWLTNQQYRFAKTQSLEITNRPAKMNESTMTVMAKVKWTGDPSSGFHGVASQWNIAQVSQRRFILGLNNLEQAHFEFGTNRVTVAAPVTFTSNEYVVITGTVDYDAPLVSLYTNGVLVGSTSAQPIFVADTNSVYIGNVPSSATLGALTGDYEWVKIWYGTALTAAQVAEESQ